MDARWVESSRELREFVKFPERLYHNDPFWVPPLWHEERHAYDARTNVMLRDNEHAMLLICSDAGTTLGRTLVYIDARFNRFYRSKVGFFGAFECIDDQAVADLLLHESSEWLRRHGMEAMRGPIHPIAESWGFLLKGYQSLPVLMAPYNPPYYHSLMGTHGLRKVMDLLAYEADLDRGYHIPERIERFVEFFHQRHPGITTRPIDVKHLLDDAKHIWSISNESLKDNWGYVPVDLSVMEDMVERLKDILDPNAVWFVEDQGVPVGYALGFPDPNPVIKSIGGHLFPCGFIQLLRVRHSARRYRLFALGVLPSHQGLGLDVLLYKSLHDALRGRLGVMEANYILENNWNIRNALEKLQMVRTKEYRIYEMPLASPPSP